MSKLLPSQLPIAVGDTVTVELFNRLVRILEINLGAVDPDNTIQLSTTERDSLNFNRGTLIFNTTNEVLQVFDGTEFIDLTSHRTYLTGLSATGSVGSVTVTT
tara:strand:- start:1452 stop:1760 length:309 start_codon:yes stop_codon:yes gene_type:complete